MRKHVLQSSKGITLMALVITIIVLLILAGISINMLLGENSIIKKATEAQEASAHASILESLQLQQADYYMDKTIGDTTLNLVEYLQEKSIIGEEVVEGKWQINVEELLGSKQVVGNGDYLTDGTDVYMVESQSSSTGKSFHTKIASITPIKIADTTENSTNETEQYSIVYYGKSTANKTIIGALSDPYTPKASKDLEKLKAYFINRIIDDIDWNWETKDQIKLDDGSVVTYVGAAVDMDSISEYVQYNNKIYGFEFDYNDTEGQSYVSNVVESGLKIKLEDINLSVSKFYDLNGGIGLFVLPSQQIFIGVYDIESDDENDNAISISYNGTYVYDKTTGEFLRQEGGGTPK